MKALLTALIVLALASSLPAETIIFSENFEGGAVGTSIAGTNGWVGDPDLRYSSTLIDSGQSAVATDAAEVFSKGFSYTPAVGETWTLTATLDIPAAGAYADVNIADMSTYTPPSYNGLKYASARRSSNFHGVKFSVDGVDFAGITDLPDSPAIDVKMVLTDTLTEAYYRMHGDVAWEFLGDSSALATPAHPLADYDGVLLFTYAPGGYDGIQITNAVTPPIGSSEVVPETYGLSRGRQVLLNRGLQILAHVNGGVVSPSPEGHLANNNIWLNSNFTTFGLDHEAVPVALANLPAGTPWGRMYLVPGVDSLYLTPEELPYVNNFVAFQYLDEPELTPAIMAEMATTYRDWNARYPNALAYSNFAGTATATQAIGQLKSYMQATAPDMIIFDFYPGFSFSDSDRDFWYATMRKYRSAALAGNDGAGTTPIPYGQFLNMFRRSYADPLPSESYVRLQQFASWAFGNTFLEAFVYAEGNWANQGIYPVLFNSPGDGSPTPVFNYVAEANRQSRNLGPALVRMVSSGIFMKPGSGKSASRTGLTEWSSHAGNTTGYTDYLTSITPTVSQGGAADTSYSDILVGYFRPLLADNSDFTFVDGLHFMIVNGASGTPFLPGAAGDPASASAQWYRLTFDFTGSNFDSLVRLSRDTGRVELVTLTHTSGSRYFLDLNLPGGTGDLFAFWNSSNPLPSIGPVLGDFDGDGDVDGADFVAWQTHFPTASGATLATGDADGDGDGDGADFVIWQTHFPTTPGGPGVSPVPEPQAVLLFAVGALGFVAVSSQTTICDVIDCTIRGLDFCRRIFPFTFKLVPGQRKGIKVGRRLVEVRVTATSPHC